MKIYLTRHGQTEWNLLGKYQGWLDSPLTQKGVLGATLLGERLKDLKFDAVYSSDLGRAKQTTQAMGFIDEAEFDERLREIDLGIWSGMHYDEIQHKTPVLYEQYFFKPLEYQPDKGETNQAFYQRVKSFVEMLDKQHHHDTVLIVCHGVTMIMLQLVLNGEPVENKVNYGVPGGTHLFVAERNNEITTWIIENDGTHL